MMASRILSRFLPTTDDGPYLHEPHTSPDDRLERGHARDSSDDHELDALLAEAENDSRPALDVPYTEDEIPASLLMENRPDPTTYRPAPDQHAEAQWRRTQERQQLHPDHRPRPPATRNVALGPTQDPSALREQAIWLWTNVQNLDAFLLEVYQYYTGHGVWSILLSRLVHLLTTGFLFSLYMFLSTCVDYKKISPTNNISDVVVPQCMKKASWGKGLMLWIFTFWWIWTFCKYLVDVRRLRQMENFYHHLLGIPDTDIQAVSWERVVQGLMKLRDLNPETADTLPKYVKNSRKQSKQRMDAHDIANRLMRRDNYSIALFNKEIFDLSLSVPFLGNRQFCSKSLEDCINFCFSGFIFNEQGQVNPLCLQRKDRHRLIQTLRQRLRFVAIMSIFLAPFTITAHCVYYFSRYYAEFRTNIASVTSRTFTPLAEWKFREFNELDHEFQYRISQAHPYAAAYLDQFPRDKTHQFLQFTSLVSGTLFGLLSIAAAWDPEAFLGFEIAFGRTAVFYIPILASIALGARSSIPEEGQVHEPLLHLQHVVAATRYCPARWKSQLHSNEVRVEFSALYQMKVVIILEEIMSVLIAPFILWKNSGKRSEMIIDFFRNSTVQVEGLGYLCTFSVFEFRKSKNVEDDAARDIEGLREEYFGTKDDKMARSQYYFMERLGRYDQQQAARLGRPYGLQLPPAFPPLSPMRQASAKRGISARRPPSRLPSPHQSLLLDVPRQQPSSAATARQPRQKQQQQQRPGPQSNKRRPNIGDYFSPDEGEEDQAAVLDAMTTSKLIEQDSTLADSWKAFSAGKSDTQEEGEAGESLEDRRPGNGVLGLLVEYSKAHAGGKGPKLG